MLRAYIAYILTVNVGV